MRLLHPGISDDDPRILARVSQPERRRNPGSAGGSSLPVHRLSGYCRSGFRRGAASGDGNPHARSAGSGRRGAQARKRGNANMRARALLRVLSVSQRLAGFFIEPHRGNVLATFDRSCYLDMDGQIIALVAPALLNGPLNLVVEMDAWQDQVAPGAVAASTDHALRIEGGIEIGLHDAVVWDATLQAWPEEQLPTLRAHLPTLQRLLDREAPEGGLAHAVNHPNASTTALERRAAPAIVELAQGLSRRDAILVSHAAGALAGLGPGLTPSGDDVLVGGLLASALHADDSRAMRQAIISTVRDRTTRISMAYLEAAARAEASESWHRLVAALAPNHPASSATAPGKSSAPDGTGLAVDDPGRIVSAARGVMAFGETSGSDMLAGFLLTVDALLPQNAERRTQSADS